MLAARTPHGLHYLTLLTYFVLAHCFCSARKAFEMKTAVERGSALASEMGQQTTLSFLRQLTFPLSKSFLQPFSFDVGAFHPSAGIAKWSAEMRTLGSPFRRFGAALLPQPSWRLPQLGGREREGERRLKLNVISPRLSREARTCASQWKHKPKRNNELGIYLNANAVYNTYEWIEYGSLASNQFAALSEFRWKCSHGCRNALLKLPKSMSIKSALQTALPISILYSHFAFPWNMIEAENGSIWRQWFANIKANHSPALDLSSRDCISSIQRWKRNRLFCEWNRVGESLIIGRPQWQFACEHIFVVLQFMF